MANAALKNDEIQEELTLPEEQEADVILPEDQQEQRVSEDDINSLKERLAEAERARQESDQRATDTARQLAEAKQHVTRETTGRFSAEEAAVVSGIAAATSEAQTAETEYANAMNNADWVAAAKAQAKLADARYDLKSYTSRQTEIAQAKTQQTEQPRQQDPLASFPPRTREWIGRNPDFLVPGSRFHSQAMAAHYEAVSQGMAPETTEYFDYIDGKVKPPRRRPQNEDAEMGTDDVEIRTEARRRQPAAPPSRSSTQQDRHNGNGRQIHLTAEEKSMALNAKETLATHPGEIISDAEALKRYAENKAAILVAQAGGQ